jgi:hypothetical protein
LFLRTAHNKSLLSSHILLLLLTEDTLEQLIHDEAEPYVQSLGRTYLAKVRATVPAICV